MKTKTFEEIKERLQEILSDDSEYPDTNYRQAQGFIEGLCFLEAITKEEEEKLSWFVEDYLEQNL